MVCTDYVWAGVIRYRTGGFAASIMVEGVRYFLGVYDSKEEVGSSYCNLQTLDQFRALLLSHGTGSVGL
jgi:hypothetical protein